MQMSNWVNSGEGNSYELSIDGWTALDLARERGHDDILALLEPKSNAGFFAPL